MITDGSASVPSIRVLLVEDDSAIIATLSELLVQEGYSVETCSAQNEAIDLLEHKQFDLVLLDVTLSQGNGFAVCSAARKLHPDLPIIFLTASDDEYSTVAGLDMGAVDYIAKPFRARELLSRMRGALRRTKSSDETLTIGSLVLDPSSAHLSKAGTEIVLSALEYRLLLYLFQNKDRLVTRENLRDAIWDSAGEYISDNAINVYIRRLREKIEDDPACPHIIITVRGLGYKVGE